MAHGFVRLSPGPSSTQPHNLLVYQPELTLSIAFTKYSYTRSSSGGGLSNDRHPHAIQSSRGDGLPNDSYPPAISKVAAVACPTTAARPRSPTIINNNNLLIVHLHFRLKGCDKHFAVFAVCNHTSLLYGLEAPTVPFSSAKAMPLAMSSGYG